MAGERLPARFSLRSQLWFPGTGKCFETATSHMHNVGSLASQFQLIPFSALLKFKLLRSLMGLIFLIKPIFFALPSSAKARFVAASAPFSNEGIVTKQGWAVGKTIEAVHVLFVIMSFQVSDNHGAFFCGGFSWPAFRRTIL